MYTRILTYTHAYIYIYIYMLAPPPSTPPSTRWRSYNQDCHVCLDGWSLVMAYLSFTCSVGSCMCIATCISSLHARNAIAHGLHMRPHNAIHNAFVAPDNIQKRRRPIESRATENLTTCCIHLFRCASSCKRNINGHARGACREAAQRTPIQAHRSYPRCVFSNS